MLSIENHKTEITDLMWECFINGADDVREDWCQVTDQARRWLEDHMRPVAVAEADELADRDLIIFYTVDGVIPDADSLHEDPLQVEMIYETFGRDGRESYIKVPIA